MLVCVENQCFVENLHFETLRVNNPMCTLQKRDQTKIAAGPTQLTYGPSVAVASHLEPTKESGKDVG